MSLSTERKGRWLRAGGWDSNLIQGCKMVMAAHTSGSEAAGSECCSWEYCIACPLWWWWRNSWECRVQKPLAALVTTRTSLLKILDPQMVLDPVSNLLTFVLFNYAKKIKNSIISISLLFSLVLSKKRREINLGKQ